MSLGCLLGLRRFPPRTAKHFGKGGEEVQETHRLDARLVRRQDLAEIFLPALYEGPDLFIAQLHTLSVSEIVRASQRAESLCHAR